MGSKIDRQALFPLSNLLQQGDLPLGDFISPSFLDSLFSGLYYTDAEAYLTDDGLHLWLTLLFEGEISLQVPGTDAVALVVASGGVGWTEISARAVIGSQPSIRLQDIPVALRFSPSILRDVATKGPAELSLTASLEFSRAEGLKFETDATLSLPRSEIAGSGTVISANELAWNFEHGRTLSEAAEGGIQGEFLGVAFRDATLELPSTISGAPKLSFQSCCIGTGGFTGVVKAAFVPPVKSSVAGLQVALTRIVLQFQASRPQMVEVNGNISVPTGQADGFLAKLLPSAALDTPIDIGIGWSRSRGFYVQAAGPNLVRTIPLQLSLGPVQFKSLYLSLTAQSGAAHVEVSFSGSVVLGPVAGSIERVGILADLGLHAGNLGPLDLSAHFKPPNGVGIAINATAVVGGGYLFFDTDKEQYAGVLQLEIAKTIAIKAIGLLTTRMPDGSKGFSLLVIITAEGFGPIQLGFGFTLTGIGGLLGVNRTCVVDTLRSGIKNGTVGSILFPQDPVRNAQRIVSDVGSVFPPALHRYVFGPMVKINWGTPPILTMEIGLVLEVPDPIRLLILGRLLAVLPEEEAALVRIRMDSLGVIDFGKGEISLDATLYDSRILAFVLTGDMALRANFGANPGFLLSVGGWNPAFPSPPGFPLLARMAITLSSSDNARLRLESYMAITSNTVQFGACVDLYFAVQPFSIEGYLGFDALFHFSPFSLQANLSASVTIRMNGSILMSVGLDATLTGPSPWHIWGSAHFSVLCFKQSVSFDVQYGSAPPPALPQAVDVKSLLTAALNDVRNWSSELPAGERPLVTFRAAAAGDSVLSVHPLAELAVRERVAPLDMTISKFGSAPVSGENSFSLKAVRTDGTEIPSVEKITDSFALAQFQDMSDDQKLSSPSFVQETAGIRFTTGEFAFGYEPALDSSITYTTLLIVPAQPAKSLPQYTMPAAVLDGTIRMGAAAQAAKKRPSGLGVRAA